MSEIRFDILHDTHVIMAPERLHRPNNEAMQTATKQESQIALECPFCEGNEALTPQEIFAMRENTANAQKWKTRVIPNLYKAVQIETQRNSKREGIFESYGGYGAHEILIDSPCHNCSMADLKKEGIENWLRTIIIRKEDLQKDLHLKYLSVFKNSGTSAGATQEHPHTQLIALPIVPKNLLRFLERNERYYHEHGRGIVNDVVQNEKDAKIRVIEELGNFIAYAPYASAFSFETIIAPTKQFLDLHECSRDEISDLAQLLNNLFTKLQRELGDFSYNINFFFAPINTNFEDETYMQNLERNFTFYIRITPRIYTLAGFELSNGMGINAILPEECAKFLRAESDYDTRH